MKISLLCFGMLATALIAPATTAAADFSITPSTSVSGVTTVNAGNQLTFEALPVADTTDSWDLDGDGLAGDLFGSPVQWAYTTPGPVSITLNAPDGQVTRTIQVLGPAADFHTSPATPVVGQPVSFAYSQRQDVAAIEWDLNGDKTFVDAFGPVAGRTFPEPGTYAVSLRVSNLDEPPARSTSTQFIRVVPPPAARSGGPVVLRLISPFPVVRITGKVTKRGARIKRLTVRAPDRATVAVRCRGRSCPFRRTNQTVKLAATSESPSKTVRVKRLERRLLRGGTSIKVLVSRQGEVGKYTRFKIRSGKSPLRVDECLTPGSTVPKECPSS
jgi:PKD repeat protein